MEIKFTNINKTNNYISFQMIEKNAWYMFVPVPSQELDFHRHMLWSFFQSFEKRCSCLFCWYWWILFPSLFKILQNCPTSRFNPYQAILFYCIRSSLISRRLLYIKTDSMVYIRDQLQTDKTLSHDIYSTSLYDPKTYIGKTTYIWLCWLRLVLPSTCHSTLCCEPEFAKLIYKE
jgi:hypothetical protein